MDLLEAIILGIIQGATEFLPVSSSGHLVLIPWWIGLRTPPPMMFSIMVHLGTTVAVLIYFRQDWWRLTKASFSALFNRSFHLENNPDLRYALFIIIGTVPAAIVGILLRDYFEQFGEPAIVSVMLLVTAALLVYGERQSQRSSTITPDTTAPQSESRSQQITYLNSLLIGCSQALAIIPGISRSGSTIAAGLFQGLDHHTATRYSFMLATPIILGAGFGQLLDVLTGKATVNDELSISLVVGFITAAIVGYASIAMMLQWVRGRGLYGFAGYCALVGVIGLGAVVLQG